MTENTDDGQNLYIFSDKKFSNLESVFKASKKYESKIWERESDSGGYETEFSEPYAEECDDLRYCVAFQRDLHERLLSAKCVTVVVSPNRNDLDTSITALALTAPIAYIALVKNHDMTLTGFRSVFRGIELIEDGEYRVSQATADDLCNLFN